MFGLRMNKSMRDVGFTTRGSPTPREIIGELEASFTKYHPTRRYSKGKMRFQSFFMSTTVHLFAAAASSATSSFPKCDCRS